MAETGIGHHLEYSNLKNAFLNNRFAHAYLIWGGSGIGKKEFAFRIARSIMCKEEDFGSCGHCVNCKRLDNFSHPDVKIISPVRHNKKGEAAFEEVMQTLGELANNPYMSIGQSSSDTIAIDDIRSLKEEIKLSPIEGDKRLFLIFNIEKMNAAASNALLKILEEPPPDVRFILTTSKLDNILATVKSRCQLLHLRQFSEDELTSLLKQQYPEKDEKELRTVSRLSSGNYDSASQYLRENISEEQSEVVKFLRTVYQGNAENINLTIKKFHPNRDKGELRNFLLLILQWFEDLILIDQDENWREKIIFYSQTESLYKFYQGFGKMDIQIAQEIFENAIHHLDHNGYVPLVITDLMIKFFEFMQQSVEKRRTA